MFKHIKKHEFDSIRLTLPVFFLNFQSVPAIQILCSALSDSCLFTSSGCASPSNSLHTTVRSGAKAKKEKRKAKRKMAEEWKQENVKEVKMLQIKRTLNGIEVENL